MVQTFEAERAHKISCFSAANQFHSCKTNTMLLQPCLTFTMLRFSSPDLLFSCCSDRSIEIFDANVAKSVRRMRDVHKRPAHAVVVNDVSVYVADRCFHN